MSINLIFNFANETIMTFEEIKQIPELQIKVDDLAEQCFYVKMAIAGRISDEAGEKNYDNIKGKYTEEEYMEALDTADRMIANLDKYGVACADWAWEDKPAREGSHNSRFNKWMMGGGC